jgi:hypothetical protein
VQVSIPHVTFSTMSIPNLKLYLRDICLLLQIFGSQPQLLEHSTLNLAHPHFIIVGCNWPYYVIWSNVTSSFLLQHNPLQFYFLSVCIIYLIFSYSFYYFSMRHFYSGYNIFSSCESGLLFSNSPGILIL